MTRPPISVIVPVHDVAGHLRACLDSLRAQTLADFECLVVDDGSTDGSAAIARAAAESDARFVVITQDNAGLGAARNAGLARARGDFVAFVDGDDRVMPDYLARLHATLVETGADWVACGLCNVFPDGSGWTHSARHDRPALSAADVTTRHNFAGWSDVITHFPSAWNKLFRRRLIEGLRFDEGTWFEDHGFFLRAAARTDHIVHLPQALYLQTRGRPGQITAADDDRVHNQFAVLDTAHDILRAGPHPGAQDAFATLAARLVHERAEALRDPARRACFAAAAAAWFAARQLDYRPDTGDGRAWGLEMSGTLPLSVVIAWDGRDAAALCTTLEGLAAQDPVGHEIILACPDGATLPGPVPATLRRVAGGRHGLACGLAAARGALVTVLAPGDAPERAALREMVAMMLAEAADFGLTGFAQGPPAVQLSGFVAPHPGAPFPAPPPGVLTVTAELAVTIDLRPAGKIFRRAFLDEAGLAPVPGRGGTRALVLGAAVLARRAVYLDWPAVHCAGPGPGGTAGHAALLRALPRAAAARLPEGWGRRIFARALREELDAAPTRAGRALVAAAGLARALRHGLTGARPAAAGLDATVGRGMARLLNPAELLGGRPLPLATDAWPEPPAALIPVGCRAALRLRADFHDHDYANLSLMGRGRRPTPLHVSLRGRTGTLVVNDRRGDGLWRAERVFPMPLSASGCELVLLTGRDGLRVLVDGSMVARVKPRRPWRRSGLRGIKRIEMLALSGGMRLVDAQLAPPPRSLAFDARLQLVAALPEGVEAASLWLRAETGPGRAETLTLTDQAIPGAPRAVIATLPGRLWRDVPGGGETAGGGADEGGTLVLRLAGPGGAIRPLRLTRAGMARQLAEFLQRDPPAADSGPVLSALDHLRDARIWQALPAAAQDRARRLAAFYRLADTLPPQPPGPAPAPDPTLVAVDAAVARLVDSQRPVPGPSPDPDSSAGVPPDPLAVLDMLALPSAAARDALLLAVSEFFCSAGSNPAGLVVRAQGLPAAPRGEAWGDSALLPFLLLSDSPARAVPVLEGLAQASGWVLTPPVAFAMRHAATALSGETRDRLLYAGMAFVRAQAGDYWGRSECAELVAAAAELVTLRDRLPWYLARDLEVFCLQVYGLSPRFWARLGHRGLPPRLALARDAFAALGVAQEARDTAGMARALDTFDAWGCMDAARVRHDLLGPVGIALEDGAAPALPALLAQGRDAGLAAIRHMAFPGAAPVGPTVAAAAAEAVTDLQDDIARAPLPRAQAALANAAEAALADPAPERLEALWDRALPLMAEESGWLGAGVLIAVIAQHSQPAAALVDRLAVRLSALSASARAALHAATAPRIAARRLAAPLRARLLPGLNPVDPAGPRAEGSALHDAIVVVFSCRAYLDSRIPALRAGWLRLLEPLGVPYVIVVGDGDGRREGDVVHLDAPDDYEGLPLKTLAAIRWVRANTDAGHMIKVDDDCFLNAPLFFRHLAWRKHACLGRKLSRVPGQTDRVWHQAKSTSTRGRGEYDRSPEPSSYPDGGSGYALSREAMVAVGRAAARPEGRRLIAASFMEDKMLGDLLALEGIAPSDEDYRIAVRRRTHRDAIPVASWQNGFLPSAAAPVMLAHLDTHADQAATLQGLAAQHLAPPKIWPSFQDVRLGYQSNALELISDASRVTAARDAAVTVVACMRNEMAMLPHFLAHYRRLGVGAFLVADNLSDDGTLEYLEAQPDVAVFSVDTDYNRSQYGVAWQQALLAGFRVGRWSLMADADELLVWQSPQKATLPALLDGPDFRDCDAARVFMLDMYPRGPLSDATFETGDPFAEAGFADRVPFLTASPMRGPFSDQPAWTSALRHRLIPGTRPNLFTAQKIALLRYHPFMRLSAGLHFVGGTRLSSRELIFGHFKYTAAFRVKAVAEVARGQHWGDAAEYRRYLALMSEGRERIHDSALSAPWDSVPFVRARLDPGTDAPPRGVA